MTIAPTIQTAERSVHGVRPQMPRPRDVLREHLHAIGYALRVPMLIAVALGVLATIILAIQIGSGDLDYNFLTQPSVLPGVIGALLPVAMWLREERFGPGFLWTLPVDRRRHALLKTLAGWLWLMGGVTLFVLSLLVLALVSGGGVLPVQTMTTLTDALRLSGPVNPAALQTVQWTPGALIWAVPFGSATALYLLASAIVLGIRYLLRWAIVLVFLLPIATGATHLISRLSGNEWLADMPARALVQLVEGRFGLEALLTLRTWSLDNRATLTTGERIHVWSSIPDLADWRTAALLWTVAGLLALWAAASRHREERRA
ncbi:MAG: hypothetical protein V4617_04475 [Gemmatimonadota bacterium]